MKLEYFAGKKFLASWKDFRQSLDNSEETLDRVIDFWSQCPIINRSIDPYDCSMWPTAWELIDSGMICRDALALCMAFTLIYADDEWKDRIKLAMIHEESLQGLVLIIDKRWVLNYSYGNRNPHTDIDFDIVEEFYFDGKSFAKLRRKDDGDSSNQKTGNQRTIRFGKIA